MDEVSFTYEVTQAQMLAVVRRVLTGDAKRRIFLDSEQKAALAAKYGQEAADRWDEEIRQRAYAAAAAQKP